MALDENEHLETSSEVATASGTTEDIVIDGRTEKWLKEHREKSWEWWKRVRPGMTRSPDNLLTYMFLCAHG